MSKKTPIGFIITADNNPDFIWTQDVFPTDEQVAKDELLKLLADEVILLIASTDWSARTDHMAELAKLVEKAFPEES